MIREKLNIFYKKHLESYSLNFEDLVNTGGESVGIRGSFVLVCRKWRDGVAHKNLSSNS